MIRQPSELMGIKRVEGDPTTCFTCKGRGKTRVEHSRNGRVLCEVPVLGHAPGQSPCSRCGGKGWVRIGPPVVGP